MDFGAVTALFLATLEQWRAEGLTQEQAAQRIGVSGPYVSQIRSGARQLGAGTTQKFADALGIGVGELLSRAEAFALAHPERVPKRVTTRDDGRPTLDRVPGYAEAEAEARRRAPYLPDSVWATTRASSGARLEQVGWPLVLELARVWHRVETGELQPYPMESGRPPPVKPKK